MFFVIIYYRLQFTLITRFLCAAVFCPEQNVITTRTVKWKAYGSYVFKELKFCEVLSTSSFN